MALFKVKELGSQPVQRRLNMQPAAVTNWSSLFQRSPMANKGASLQFVATVVKEGKKLAQLQKPEVHATTGKWITFLVLYVVGDVPTIASIKRYIAVNWT